LAIRFCAARFRLLLRCLLLIGSACLTLLTDKALCSKQGNAGPTGTSPTQNVTAAELTKRPVTVADSIQMTRLGDPQYTEGASSKGLVAKFSPNGKRFVVVLKKGHLETNANEYSLILFETDEVFHSPKPRVLLSMVSYSNRPAIQNVVWMDDNDTILFLGEHPGETTQLYSLQCSSRELKKLTHHATNLTAFVVAAKGDEIVFAAEGPETPVVNENTARQGINVTNEMLSNLIAGKRGGGSYADYTLFISQAGSSAETRITTEGRFYGDWGMTLSPDGLHLVLKTLATHVPLAWTEYEDKGLRASSHPPSAPGASSGILQYELVDTRTGLGHVLLDAPISTAGEGSEVVWSPDSQSVVLSNMYLPLNVDKTAERALRKTHTFLAEVKISSRQLVKISDEDLRLLDWDAKANDLVCDVGRLDSLTGKATRKAYFRKSDDTWSQISILQVQAKAAAARPAIVLNENMNQAPRIFAVDPDTGRKSLLVDLNPQFQALALARVEEVAWKTSRHNEVKAGLYWPTDYVAGRKYPLVIQTHGWDPGRFWIDGPYPTAFAAQALAGKGFFVLQVDDTDWHLVETPKEAPAAMAVYDSAIDFLDRKGLIDRNRIGLTGFSRTYWYVTYTLTHSRHHFAAASVADGVDYSYFQYLENSNADQSWAGGFDQTNGASPFGKGLLKWLKVSPAFLMDKIETPLRVQTLNPGSLLSDWHWFSGLTRLGKPVEMTYIPEGTHILEKPWERMISQQGNVDWFCFWLKGERDPDPAKTDQYTRWQHLRAGTVVDATPAQSDGVP
jgi:dipeptidyl aminopeptidase/acylaminoacyl peptidase